MSRFPRLLSAVCVSLFTVSQLVGQPMNVRTKENVGLVGHWTFDGDLHDGSGHGNDAYVRKPQFEAGQQGQAVRLDGEAVLVPDDANLRLNPGLRIDCWLRYTAPPPSGWQEIVQKGNEYMLRVNPANEGGGFGFFVYLDGWETRVQSTKPVEPNVWYHLVAGWDGKELTLTVNGEEFRQERTGVPVPTDNPLKLGPLPGLIDDLRIENPAAAATGVAYWPFDGDLRDRSGHGHGIVAVGTAFAPGRCGQALQTGSPVLEIPDHPDFQLAAGLRIDCSVRFEALPPEGQILAIKNDEYQLRVNPAKEGGRLAFFVNLDGQWEPRVTAEVKVETGVWYRIAARWDGLAITLDVNGERTRTGRSGMPQSTENPLLIGPVAGQLDELRIENPRWPVLRVEDLLLEHTILRGGRLEKLTAVVRNHGSQAESCTLRLDLSPGTECLTPVEQALGTLANGETKTAEWTVRGAAKTTGVASLRLTGTGFAPIVARRALPFFAAEDPVSPVGPNWPPPRNTDATTYYVDSVQGNNANTGTSPEAAWQDFTNINGKTLGPGERLLIKRGSVINQELMLLASGTADNWAEIGAYGSGPRPIIRRNWDIGDRCVLVSNPDYLRISSLVVCQAGKGLVVNYWQEGHRGLVIEDCIAHHIEGLYRPNSHGIPEWRDRGGAGGDSLGSSAGFAIVGAQAEDLVLRDCEMFQCSWGFFVKGDGLTVDRVYCHDNHVHNTSPHPAMVAIRRSYLQNSIFDAPGWHASAGTMGIMLGNPQGFIIRNCFFRNQPDSGSHDEGGIDFENHGNGCLIDHCTFQNNAGAAIEVLGLKAPQPKNVEIANSRFILNNTAKKLGPSEIYIWGKGGGPDVCCSTGSIHDNGYVLNPGIEFFVNEAPKTTNWTLRDNRQYATAEELVRAMPYNDPPQVEAGPEMHTDQMTVRLAGAVTDDGKGRTAPLKVTWEVMEGPGSVSFADAAQPTTTAQFAVPGDYLLRLVADDGELWMSDWTWVHVLPTGATVAKAWEFNRLDKEGWSEANLGTRFTEWKDQPWPCVSYPIHYVAGGYYMVAVEDSTDAHLLSPADLDLDLATSASIRIRFQNHTPATQMRFQFTTAASPDWNEGKTFAVVANDDAPREYTVDLSDVPGWTGRLKQLRLDLATGTPLTGTCRIDYLWIGSRLRQ